MSCTQDSINTTFYSCTASPTSKDAKDLSYIKNISTFKNSYIFVPAYKELPSICKKANNTITCTYKDTKSKTYTSTLTPDSGYYVQNIPN